MHPLLLLRLDRLQDGNDAQGRSRQLDGLVLIFLVVLPLLLPDPLPDLLPDPLEGEGLGLGLLLLGGGLLCVKNVRSILENFIIYCKK